VSDDRDLISEQLDGDRLGEQPGDIDPPGLTDFPPERPLGVEDPSLFDDDDLATRSDLRRDLAGDDSVDVVLVDPHPVDGSDHDESAAGVGIVVDENGAGVSGDLSAEEAAVHLIPESDDWGAPDE
jgi:hypothetical protein